MRKHRWIQVAAALWLCSLVVGVSLTVPSGDWPQQINGRILSRCECGFVYARERSAAGQVQEVLATVIEDMKTDGAVAVPPGLVLATDADEEYPCDPNRLADAVKKTDPNDSHGTLKAISAARKQSRDMGLDTATLLSAGPLPIPPSALHEIATAFPADVERQIGWCVIVPTDGCLKAGLKETMDAAMKKEKPGLAKRMMLRAAMPLVERQVMSMMKKGRQAALYGFLLQTQKDLSPEQRQAKIDAYKEKLGLKGHPNPAKVKEE
jgi:hypothetical protein